MKKEVNLLISPAEAASEEFYKPLAAKAAGLEASDISGIRITRRSIDARGRHIRINMILEVFSGELPASAIENSFRYEPVHNRPEVAVIGAGPAGLFASLVLIEMGYRPLVFERGWNVTRRKLDIDMLESNHLLDPDSNYCFGEGGAGTFSDGKLYTRSKKRGDIGRILEILYLHGASEDILYEAHPHIGSDQLPRIVTNIRQTIESCGGIVQFNTRITDIAADSGAVTGLLTSAGEKIRASAYIFATGHSARDTYSMLQSRGISLEAKPFAMGVRVEHPQELIDHIQYHGRKDRHLPPAAYNLVEQVNQRGVYSFCMCPGGQIVPSATANYEIVVNGMSVSARNSPFANSGIVVQVMPEDYRQYQNLEGLAGLRLQELLEQKAYKMIHQGQRAPGQRLTDFVAGRISADLPVNSYLPGLVSSPMHEWLPDFVRRNLQEGFQRFGLKMKGFLTREAVIAGVETRTSSPVRIPRNTETGSHQRFRNLFAAGEGAGYAGGIVSSAMDGETIARFCAASLSLKN